VDPAVVSEFTRLMPRAQLVELDQGHELNADLAGLWRIIDVYLGQAL